MAKRVRLAEDERPRDSMKSLFAIVLLGIFPQTVLPQHIRTAGKPVASVHRYGPNGWEGWTLNYVLPDIRPGDRLPMKLVLAHNGHIVRRIPGDLFISNWIFVAGGKQVAYETGPLHFAMTCVLLDTRTGKRLASYDCEYVELPVDAPDWLEQLEASTVSDN